MTDPDPFLTGRPRPISTVLDTLRARIDVASFDVVVLTLECVAADLGYGDIRPLPGSVAWIDRLRSHDRRMLLLSTGERAFAALELAGVADRFDGVTLGSRTPASYLEALDAADVEPERGIAVDVVPSGIAAARDAGLQLAIAVARGAAAPEQLRLAGADVVVADLQELLGPT